MRTLICVFLFWSFFSCKKFDDKVSLYLGHWEKTRYSSACFDWTIRGPIIFEMGKNAILGLGYDLGIAPNERFYRFSIDGGWQVATDIPPFPGMAHIGTTVFTIEGEVYVGLGICMNDDGTTTYPRDFWVLDTNTCEWRCLEWEFPGEGRKRAVAFVIDGNAYVGMGVTQNGLAKDFYVLNPAKGWKEIDSLKELKGECVAFALGGAGFVGGGFSSGEIESSESLSKLDPAIQTWQTLPVQSGTLDALWRTQVSLFYLEYDGKKYAYLVGGVRNGLGIGDCWRYDAEQNVWFQEEGYPEHLGNLVGFTIDNRAFVLMDNLETWEFVVEK